jgi:hypothetical protein
MSASPGAMKTLKMILPFWATGGVDFDALGAPALAARGSAVVTPNANTASAAIPQLRRFTISQPPLHSDSI